jgi:hypothetical protein
MPIYIWFTGRLTAVGAASLHASSELGFGRWYGIGEGRQGAVEIREAGATMALAAVVECG